MGEPLAKSVTLQVPQEFPIPKIQIMLFSYHGMVGQAVDCLVKTTTEAARRRVPLLYSRVGEDALIERSRSCGCEVFLESGADCLLMLDHDILYEPEHVFAQCSRAVTENAVLGGLYSFRTMHKGYSSRMADKLVSIPLGRDEIVPAKFVATGFMSIPRAALLTIIEKCSAADAPPDIRIYRFWRETKQYWDLFRCVTCCTTPDAPCGKLELLSEDWAFSMRATYAGIKCGTYAYPTLQHVGEYAYTQTDGMVLADQPAEK